MTIGWATTLVIALTLLSNSSFANDFEMNQIGDNFTLTFTQTGNNHVLEFDVDGDGETATITQTGADKTLIIDFEGTPHNFTASQTGTGNHYAYIDIYTSSNDTAQINATQSGSTSQSYSITGSCYATSGCALTVNQTGN
jgi:hypothetical protein